MPKTNATLIKNWLKNGDRRQNTSDAIERRKKHTFKGQKNKSKTFFGYKLKDIYERGASISEGLLFLYFVI